MTTDCLQCCRFASDRAESGRHRRSHRLFVSASVCLSRDGENMHTRHPPGTNVPISESTYHQRPYHPSSTLYPNPLLAPTLSSILNHLLQRVYHPTNALYPDPLDPSPTRSPPTHTHVDRPAAPHGESAARYLLAERCDRRVLMPVRVFVHACVRARQTCERAG